jgi:3-hydroxy-3-methylglutaryl CoA synthase
MVGIVGYGAGIPFLRIKVEEINRVWGNIPLHRIKNVQMLTERTVLQPDEDTVTLAVGATRRAIEHANNGDKAKIDAIFLGTCTNPYDTRASVTLVEEALALNRSAYSADIQFGGKSGTTAMQMCLALIIAGMAEQAISIGSDTINRHTSPGRLSEYAASAGAVALVLGKDDVIAEIKGTTSYASDLSDFFRLEGERYINDIGPGGKMYPAFEIGMAGHIVNASTSLLKQVGMKPTDYDYAVFQQPDGAIPYVLGERLGFTKEQIQPGVVSTEIGDCGSASSLLGLANVLDKAKAGQKIFLAAYGFGAGADAFSLETTSLIEEKRPQITIRKLLDNKAMIDYAKAVRNEYKYAQEIGPLYL